MENKELSQHIEDTKKDIEENMRTWKAFEQEKPAKAKKLMEKMNKETVQFIEKIKKEGAKLGLEIDLVVYATRIERKQP